MERPPHHRLHGGGWILLITVDSPLWLYIVYGVIMNVGYNGGLYKVSYPAVNRFFIRLRGRGIGLVTLGSGFGGTFLVPLAAILITSYGWRTAAVIIGVITLAVGIPACFLFVTHPPEHYGLHPDNETPEEAQRKAAELRARGRTRAAATGLVDYTEAQILRMAAYWFIIIAGGGSALGAAPLPLFQNVRLQQVGYSLTEAAYFYGLNSAFTIVGRGSVALFGDWLAERLSIRFTLALCYFMEAIGVFLFALAFSPLFIWGWVIIHGIGYGASIPLSGQIIGAYFGRRAMGFAYGLRLGLTGVVSMTTPFLMGWVADISGDWILPFIICVGGFIFAGLAIVWAAPPKPKEAS